MERKSASYTWIASRAWARATGLMTSFTSLCGRIIKLWSQTFGAETAFKLEMRWTCCASQWARSCRETSNITSIKVKIIKKFKNLLTIASFTVMMTLLAAKFSFEEAFWTLGMALTSSKFPALWTFYTLISSGSTTSVTTQVTLNATASITVISVGGEIGAGKRIFNGTFWNKKNFLKDEAKKHQIANPSKQLETS